jgi:hypothetical protein
MSNLLDLAAEPFSDVISLLDTIALVKLWLCGNVRLQWRLGKGKAVREMSLDWRNVSEYVWPPLIIELAGLTSFSLSCGFSKPVSFLLGHHLSTLSRNLKKLFLQIDSSLQAFQELHSTIPDHFHCLETLHLSSMSVSNRIEIKIPATVTDLSLSSNRALGTFPLSCLPPNLIKLRASVQELEIGDFRFPSTLTSIQLFFSRNPNWTRVFHLVPSTIKILMVSCRAPNSGRMKLDDWIAISAFNDLECLGFNHSYGVEEALLLPRGLKQLSVTNPQPFGATDEWCIELLKALPQNLELLEGLWPPVITPAIAKNIPRAVKTTLGASIAPQAVSFLPNSIIDVEVTQKAGIELILSFPSNLHRLRLPELPRTLAEKLPNGLKSLQLEGKHAVLSAETVEILPRGLTNLTLSLANNPMSDIDGVLEALPPALTEFSAFPPVHEWDPVIVAVPTSSKSSQFIPRCMAELGIGCLDFSESSMAKWILGLPTNLYYLRLRVKYLQNDAFSTIGQLYALTDLEISALNTPEVGWARFLQFDTLPQKWSSFILEDLSEEFKESNGSDIADNSLRGAPQTLQHLSLPRSPLLTEYGLALHLPTGVWVSQGGIHMPYTSANDL